MSRHENLKRVASAASALAVGASTAGERRWWERVEARALVLLAQTTPEGTDIPPRRWWVSWYDPPGIPFSSGTTPVWSSGSTFSGLETIVAAILALDETEVKEKVLAMYDLPEGGEVKWRFCEERPPNWSPYCDRFPKRSGLEWPE